MSGGVVRIASRTFLNVSRMVSSMVEGVWPFASSKGHAHEEVDVCAEGEDVPRRCVGVDGPQESGAVPVLLREARQCVFQRLETLGQGLDHFFVGAFLGVGSPVRLLLPVRGRWQLRIGEQLGEPEEGLGS